MAGPKVEVEISAEIAEFKKNLKLAQGQLNEFATDAGKRLKSLGESIKSIAVPAGVGAAAIAGIGVAAVVSYGRLQSLEKGLEAVSGSSEAAKKQLNDLREVAALPGLGLEEAIRGSISLQAIGISADEAKRAILQFGNAVATVGKGRAELDRALYGLQQLANTDFPLGEDLNIIKDAIPQVSKLLTEAFGANRSDELAKLGITSKQVVETILTGLEKLPRVAGGVENAIENMQDGITEAWQEIGKAINEALDIEGVMNKVGDAIGGVVEWFRALDPKVRDAIVYIGAGTAAFLGLLAAAGAIIAIAPLVASSLTIMTGGIAALTAAVGVAALYILNNWSKISISIQEHNANILHNLSKFTKAMADLALTLGATNEFAVLTAAQAGLSAGSERLRKNVERTKDELALQAIVTKNAATNSAILAESEVRLGESLKVNSGEAAKYTRSILDLTKAQIALNGVVFNPKKVQDRNLRELDRGSTIAIPEAEITGVISQAQALAIDAADTFNEYFSTNIGTMIGEGIGNIANSIGGAIADGGNIIEAFGRGVLDTFGQFLSNFGKKLIEYGIAAGAFAKLQLALANPFTTLIAAPLAIAAGAALMIAGAAATQAATGGFSSGGQGSQQGTFTTGEVVRRGDIRGDNAQLFLRGSDIYIAGNRYQAQIGRS